MTIDFSPLAETGVKYDFYFLRHGESEGNAKDHVQGRLDYALSERGRGQAMTAAKWFLSKSIGLVLSTPLARGLETARIIATAGGLSQPELADELLELETGRFTGMTLDEAKTAYPAMYADFLRRSWDAVEGAEDSRRMSARAAAAWSCLLGRARGLADGHAILSVAHAGILQWILKVTTGGTHWYPLYPMGNCGVFHFSVDGNVTRWEQINLRVTGT